MPTPHRTRVSLPRTSAALICAAALAATTGCQTPPGPNTVAPPATGMIGQPAAYGSWATPPQGAAYPPVSSPPPMPGPAGGWQGTAAAPSNTWSWSQPGQPATPGVAPPSLEQYGNQLQAQAQQYQQGLTNQAQAQPQQYANEMQQQLAAQQQQLANQAQNSVNQYQQGLNNQVQQFGNQLQNQTQQAFNGMQQQAQQYLAPGQQQVTAQMPQWQPANNAPSTSWNPFATSATSLPPARATPVQTVPRY